LLSAPDVLDVALRPRLRASGACRREAGYDDAAQFCKLFRKKIGLSPAKFRTAMP
jgi:hypothetical protein